MKYRNLDKKEGILKIKLSFMNSIERYYICHIKFLEDLNSKLKSKTENISVEMLSLAK